MTAAAKANCRAASEAEGLAFLIDNFEIPFDTQRAVVEDSDFRSGQEDLRQICAEKISRTTDLLILR
jgi:hypothetical protein